MDCRRVLTFFLVCLGALFPPSAAAEPSIEEMDVRAVITKEGVLAVEESLSIFKENFSILRCSIRYH